MLFTGYFMEGFLTLQMLITYIFAIGGVMGAESQLDYFSVFSNLKPPVIKMQRFPHASWVNDELLKALEDTIGLIIMMSFVYTCLNTVKIITMEKEKQLKVRT